MNTTTVIEILNELLTWERRSLVNRLVESGVFVSRLSVADVDVLRSAARNASEHAQWLAEAIIQLGGTPGFRFADVSTGDLHYLELHHVLPRLIADREMLIDKYADTTERLAGEPMAAPLVQRILARHRESVTTILAARHAQAVHPA